MKKLLIIVSLVVVAALALVFLHKPHTGTTRDTVMVKRGTIHEKAVAVGNIVPQHVVTVKSQLSGMVEKLLHDAGDFVRAHDILLQVKPNPTPQEYAKAIALVEEDKATVLGLTQKIQNYHGLLQSKTITKNYMDYLTAKQDLAFSQAQLANDEQNLALLTQGKTIIDGHSVESSVVSPIDGHILQRNVDVGDPVISLASSQVATILFTIANMDHLVFKGSVDEADAGRLTLGMRAEVTIGAFPHKILHGILSKFSLQSDQKNSAFISSDSSGVQTPFNVGFEVEISKLEIPKDMALRSGYSATADITIKTAKDVLMLPERVIIFKNKNSFVKLPAQGKQNATLVPVKTGLSDGVNIEIVSGLKEKQRVLDGEAS